MDCSLLTTPTYMRLRLVALAACALGLSPFAVEAQTTCTPSFTKVITEFGGRTTANYSTLPINIDECIDNPITIDIQFTSLPTSEATLTVWEGSDCFNSTARIGTTKTCDLLTEMDIPTSGSGPLSISMADLACMVGLDENQTLYFLPLANKDAATEVTNCDTLTIKIDTVAPAAPTNVQGGSGESSVNVSWTSAGDDTEEFIIYYDPDDTTCASPLLVAGSEVDPAGLRSVRASKGGTSKSITIGSVLAVGESAAVGVVAVDIAGNESVLSTTACLAKVETTSWLDLHEAQGGKTGNTCSVAALSDAHLSMLALWSMLIALLSLRAARRIS